MRAESQDAFIETTLRHFAVLRNPAPGQSRSDTPFPDDWFDLPERQLADLGAMFFLISLTGFHRNRSLADAFSVLEPPLRLGQYRIFRSGGHPRAFITWGGLCPAAEHRLAIQHVPLEPQDWNSGPSMWLTDFVAPFGHIRQIVPMLSENPNLTSVRTLWHNRLGTRYRIVEWSRPASQSRIRVKSYGVGQFEKHLAGEG